MIEKLKRTEADREAGVQRVQFVLPCNLWAKGVSVVGTFNDWSLTANPMVQKLEQGVLHAKGTPHEFAGKECTWRAMAALPIGKIHAFRYYVRKENGDWEWVNDWGADDHRHDWSTDDGIPMGQVSIVDLTHVDEEANAESPAAEQ